MSFLQRHREQENTKDSWLCWSKHGDSILRQGRMGQLHLMKEKLHLLSGLLIAEAASASPACHLTTQGALLWHLHHLRLLTP